MLGQMRGKRCHDDIHLSSLRSPSISHAWQLPPARLVRPFLVPPFYFSACVCFTEVQRKVGAQCGIKRSLGCCL